MAGALGRLVLTDGAGAGYWVIRLQGLAVWLWWASSLVGGGVVARAGLGLLATRARGTPIPLPPSDKPWGAESSPGPGTAEARRFLGVRKNGRGDKGVRGDEKGDDG